MKTIKSPWLTNIAANNTPCQTWYYEDSNSIIERVLIPWVCSEAIEELFDLEGATQIRLVATKTRPKGTHSIRVTPFHSIRFFCSVIAPLEIETLGIRNDMFGTLRLWFRKCFDEFNSNEIFIHLELEIK